MLWIEVKTASEDIGSYMEGSVWCYWCQGNSSWWAVVVAILAALQVWVPRGGTCGGVGIWHMIGQREMCWWSCLLAKFSGFHILLLAKIYFGKQIYMKMGRFFFFFWAFSNVYRFWLNQNLVVITTQLTPRKGLHSIK